jgi:uncharacterized membrane protein (UPF0182 family)
MWKVASVHFGLTIIFGLILTSSFQSASQMPYCLDFFYWLQPQFWVRPVIFDLSIDGRISFLLKLAFYVFSIPIWSLCFSWIYVKLLDRLNHFQRSEKEIF